MDQEEKSDSDNEGERRIKNSMVLNELAEFDDNNMPDEDNLLADDQPEI